MKKAGKLLTLLFAGSLAISASASLYSDSWESGLGNWTLDVATNATSVTTPAAAVTDGTYALKMEHDKPQGAQANMVRLQTTDFFNAVSSASATDITVDMYAPVEITGGGWAQMGVILAGNFNGSGYAEVRNSANINGNPGLHTITLDTTGIDWTGATWARATLYYNGSGTPARSPVYADNFQVIPEPATLGLFGITAALAFIVRRIRM